jgi:predicted O-linked N-acetylglucosamine transferase (SPINDLY family)
MVSRMGSSILKNIGHTELITKSFQGYIKKCITLSVKKTAIKNKIIKNRKLNNFNISNFYMQLDNSSFSSRKIKNT